MKEEAVPAATKGKKTKSARPPVVNTKTSAPRPKAKASPAPVVRKAPVVGHTLNAAQRDVLKAVADGDKITSNVTEGGVVSGIASVALERQGLVKIKTVKGQTGRTVSITAKGRKLAAR